MAVDDSNLYSRTKNKLQSAPNDYKSSRRSSLPPELLLGHDIRGRLQRNIKNLEPIHLRRPKKRPSIFPGRNCLNFVTIRCVIFKINIGHVSEPNQHV